MPGHVTNIVCVRDLSAFDHVGDAPRGARLVVVGGPVRHPDLTVGVGQQLVWKVVFLGEGLVVFDAVEADAEDDRPLGVEVLNSVPESFTLDRSPRGVGHWIEPEDDFLVGQRGQADLGSVVRGDREVRRVVSNIEHAASIAAFRVAYQVWDSARRRSTPGCTSSRGSSAVLLSVALSTTAFK